MILFRKSTKKKRNQNGPPVKGLSFTTAVPKLWLMGWFVRRSESIISTSSATSVENESKSKPRSKGKGRAKYVLQSTLQYGNIIIFVYN